VNKEELQIRRRHQMMYQINKKYFKKGEHPEYERFNEKNIKILEEYKKNERT
tara:strand:- start:199 stop:354 length:156 start_codon:yes stop_codon:yes gene_type:complete